MLNDNKIRELIENAEKARTRSYSPYSNFKVGAALLAGNGKIFTGCNIENAAFSPTNCAERTAFFKAVSEGIREFTAIASVGGKDGEEREFCSPCGVCRQVMMEFVDPKTFEVIMAKGTREYRISTLAELLPYGFKPDNLGN